MYCFTRVRNVDGEPLILETSYYPQYIYPNLTRELVQTHSFYSLLYHVGITPFSAEDSYESVILDAPRASLLGVEPGSCAFYHQRRTRTEDGRIYEYTRSYIRGDRVRLDVHMQKSGMSFMTALSEERRWRGWRPPGRGLADQGQHILLLPLHAVLVAGGIAPAGLDIQPRLLAGQGSRSAGVHIPAPGTLVKDSRPAR